MSQHQVALGPQNTFPVGNGYAPRISEGGPRAAVINLDFTTDAIVTADFTVIQDAGALSFLQSIFVDNSQNPNALTLVFDQTNQRIVVPAQAAGVWPVVAPISTKLTATTTPGVGIVCPIIGLNMPMPLTQWGPITVNVAAVNASMVPVQKNATVTVITLTGGDDAGIALNAARTRLQIVAQPGNIAACAYNYAAAAVVGQSPPLLPGQGFDSSVGPVSTQAIRVRGTAGDVVTFIES